MTITSGSSGKMNGKINTIFGERDRSNPLANSEKSVEYCLDNPLYCGFLLKFCESEHNSENVRFILAVDGFRDMVLAHDPSTWTKTWKELDRYYIHGIEDNDADESGNTEKSRPDPQEWISRFSQTDFDRAARYIWNEYVADSSSSQICMPANVEQNTKKRYELRNIYGPDIFNESCIDPIKTVKRDILPRFIVSQVYRFLEDHLKQDGLLQNLSVETLSLILPNNKRFDGKKHEAVTYDREFELHEILDTGILYYEFLTYLRASVSSENLLCVRMINIYEDLIENPARHDEAVEQAWRIYKSFIAPGSVYEISLNHLDRKEVMLRMASPSLLIFESSKKSAYHALRSKFEQYRGTSQYKGLARILKEKLTALEPPEEILSKQSNFMAGQYACFGK